ncbi:hypothetical protein [Streptomyces hilarionis]|uniref:hypothetical protein n=1 Tax=Streptomyces hilarionis TaxID=2839954 RepID=UPI002119DC6C|nr:hypothetical protein [Streptomyces hilarionis]MCQ9131045.1 hypothetical protein [Streptomyces hilarionis]
MRLSAWVTSWTWRRNKNRLFDAYARRSDTAEASPDAVDVSDDGLARRIVEEEQTRLALRPRDAPEPSHRL